MRIVLVGWLLLFSLAVVGCDTFYSIQGRAVEAGEMSYEFIESRVEFEKRLGDRPRMANLTFRLFVETYEGEREWKIMRYYPHEQERGDSLAVWQIGRSSPTWTRLIVECDGFVPVEIPGNDLPDNVSEKYLLLRMRRYP